MTRRIDLSSEQGTTAILVAASLVAIFGFAALAVDTSGFYQTARTDQTTADLACLAGVAELPDPDEAFTKTIAYAKANWPSMAGASTNVVAADTRTLTDGAGNVVTIHTDHGGDPDVMYVSVNQVDPTTFGAVVGVDEVNIFQEAACEREIEMGGVGALPIGALPGTFNGNLFDCAAKVTGNCGALDTGSGGADWRTAVGSGWDQQLQKHHGPETSVDADTGSAVVDCPSPGPCSANLTESGNMEGPFRQGTGDRLSNTSGADCIIGGTFNCDSRSQVFGTSPQTLASVFGSSAPGWWEESLFGPYVTARTGQYYFDGDIAKCDSPRLATVPIVARDRDWDLGDPSGTWPNGKKEMKVVGFYVVYIREPDTPGELGSGPIQADIVHMGPNATCDGEPYNPFQTGIPVESVKLVQA